MLSNFKLNIMKRQKSELQCRDRYEVAEGIESISWTITISNPTQVDIIKVIVLIAWSVCCYFGVIN